MASHRHVRVAVRGPVAIAVGVAVGAVAVPLIGWVEGLLVAWAAAAATTVVWLLRTVWPMDARETRAHATAEDPGRPIARAIALVGSIASLGAVVAVLVGSHDEARGAFVAAGVAILAVVASWSLIQVDYMLRYAHRYYSSPAAGKRRGIDFNQDDDPMYSDFGYFSVGLGMTYQVSDTNITTNEIRRIVVAQTLLAYLFGAVILASVINLVAGLGG